VQLVLGSEVPFSLSVGSDTQYEVTVPDDVNLVENNFTLTVGGLEFSSFPADSSGHSSKDWWSFDISIITNALLLIGIVAGNFSGSWSVLWSFLNMLQLISYIPMKNIPLPQVLVDFLVDILNVDIVPSFFNIAVEDDRFPSANVQRLKVDSVVFMINTTHSLTVLLTSLAVWPVLKLLSKLPDSFLQKLVLKRLESLKWNFFLRFFIEAYMELTFFAFLQLKCWTFEAWFVGFCTILSGMFLVSST
jgi:hypothetical protein